MSAIAAPVEPAALNRKLLDLLMATAVGVGVFLSGFVLREPAPYELYMAGLVVIWGLFGMRLSATVIPLAGLLGLFVVGGLVSMTQMKDITNIPLYLAVTGFLALTSVFLASVIERNSGLYRTIFRAWIVAAVLTSLAGMAGYFGVPGAEVFTRYGRAAGAFEDPNVFGPFLVLPATYLLYLVLTSRANTTILCAIPLLIIIGGLFLSFSRGAWGLIAFSAVTMTMLTLLANRSGRVRLRIFIMGTVAAAALLVALIIALQIPSVAELFSSRAQLVQEYDAGRFGRFDRHILGFVLAIEKPLGIGPLMFGQLYGEDTHNIWLKALLDYSWIGFSAYLILILWTLAAGLQILFRSGDWQPYFLTIFTVFAGHVLLGTVIDTDHWRHFYLLLGMMWGAIALERRSRRMAAPVRPEN